jgi:ribosome-binding ATPase YchF (GTP1/OBG family)
VGYPNAGKSSLINALTRAGSKVGLSFTTMNPKLGMMTSGELDYDSDIRAYRWGQRKPWARHEFLRISSVQVAADVVDVCPMRGGSPKADYAGL